MAAVKPARLSRGTSRPSVSGRLTLSEPKASRRVAWLFRALLCAAPLFAAGCRASYESYRTPGASDGDVGPYTGSDREPSETYRGGRDLGPSVIYSDDYSGGYGPGSYGGSSKTVIRPGSIDHTDEHH